MELARDPRALLRDGDACRRVALPLGLGRAYLGCLGLHGALANGEAGEPADRELHRDEDELGGGVTGNLMVQGHRAADDDRQADARFQVVAQVPEQERDCHSDDEEAVGEGEHPPVDKRDSGRQQPVRRGCGEGKAPAREDR